MYLNLNSDLGACRAAVHVPPLGATVGELGLGSGAILTLLPKAQLLV